MGVYILGMNLNCLSAEPRDWTRVTAVLSEAANYYTNKAKDPYMEMVSLRKGKMDNPHHLNISLWFTEQGSVLDDDSIHPIHDEYLTVPYLQNSFSEEYLDDEDLHIPPPTDSLSEHYQTLPCDLSRQSSECTIENHSAGPSATLENENCGVRFDDHRLVNMSTENQPTEHEDSVESSFTIYNHSG